MLLLQKLTIFELINLVLDPEEVKGGEYSNESKSVPTKTPRLLEVNVLKDTEIASRASDNGNFSW